MATPPSHMTHYATGDEPAPPAEAEGMPTVVDMPHASQDADVLSCTMGNWTGEPTAYTYEWMIDGVALGASADATYVVIEDDVGKTASCVVSATNEVGTTIAGPSNAVTVESFNARR